PACATFLSTHPPPPTPPLFPYTTLFRSATIVAQAGAPPSERAATTGPRTNIGARTAKLPRAEKTPSTQSQVRERNTCQPSRSSRSEEHTSELQSRFDLVCRLLLEKKKKK